jgi:hypothetical protein
MEDDIFLLGGILEKNYEIRKYLDLTNACTDKNTISTPLFSVQYTCRRACDLHAFLG